MAEPRERMTRKEREKEREREREGFLTISKKNKFQKIPERVISVMKEGSTRIPKNKGKKKERSNKKK